MTDTTYTAITFAPVQGFIEKSRKLRDLYGSSFILSYIARAICDAAKKQGHQIVSPALIDVTQGTPNQIVVKGDFAQKDAKAALNDTWKTIINLCRQWIEERIEAEYQWRQAWDLWTRYAWEFFWAQGETITQARQALNNIKRSRDWVGINWQGESSTLSGVDTIAWYGMSKPIKASDRNLSVEDKAIRKFYTQLSEIPELGQAFVDASEQLSIPELVKRLLTYSAVTAKLKDSTTNGNLPSVEIPDRFRDVSQGTENWTGWFQGDGDRIGNYLKQLASTQTEDIALNQFSQAMMDWGKKPKAPHQKRSHYLRRRRRLSRCFLPHTPTARINCYSMPRVVLPVSPNLAETQTTNRCECRLCLGCTWSSAAGCTAKLPRSRTIC